MAMWMIYAAAVAALLAAGGLALERLCERADVARRFVWLGALTLAVAIPLTASPPERVEGSPMGATGDLQIGTVGGAAQAPASDGTTETRRSQRGRSGAFGSVAFVFAWALASLLVFTVLATVLTLSLRARRRWDRRRIGDERVYVSRRFGPALVGIARPAIVIPRWVLRLGEAVGNTVVKHEREHARAGDHLALLYAALVAVMFPWSPAIWWMCMRLGAAVEIDCDRRVIASGIPASVYGSLLLGIGAGRQGGLFALGMANSGSLLERRLTTMSANCRRVGASMAVVLGVGAVVSVAAACNLPAPAGIAPVVGEVLDLGAGTSSEMPSRTADPERIESIDQVPGAADSRTVIRGRNRSPYLVLDSGWVAANPLVLLDDQTVEGGLTVFLGMMDTLEFRLVEKVVGRTAEELYGERAAGGAVRISTRGSGWRSSGQNWQRVTARWEETERELEATEPEWNEAADRDRTALLRATGPDGRVRIQDRTGTGLLTLGAAEAARNPPVQLDGKILRGGLGSLLTMIDTLDVVSFGYHGVPPRVVFETSRREGGQ